MPRNIDAHVAAMDELLAAGSDVVSQARDRNNNRLMLNALAASTGNPAVAMTQVQVDALVEDQLADTQALQSMLDAAIAAMTP